jgi:hypothetical protein
MEPLRTKFKGFELHQKSFLTRGFKCKEWRNQCEVIQFLVNHQVVACWGDLCERYHYSQPYSLQIVLAYSACCKQAE